MAGWQLLSLQKDAEGSMVFVLPLSLSPRLMKFFTLKKDCFSARVLREVIHLLWERFTLSRSIATQFPPLGNWVAIERDWNPTVNYKIYFGRIYIHIVKYIYKMETLKALFFMSNTRYNYVFLYLLYNFVLYCVLKSVVTVVEKCSFSRF